MGAGASIDMNSLPDRMTLEEVEDKVGFQARLLGKVQERFNAVASTEDKKISKEHFLVGIKNGMGGEPGLDRPPEELQAVQEEQAQKAIEDAAREKAKMEKQGQEGAAVREGWQEGKTRSRKGRGQLELLLVRWLLRLVQEEWRRKATCW